jgi:phosphoglycerol transferase
LYKNFGNITIEEIIFHLKVPLTGTDNTMIDEFLEIYVPLIIGLTVIISFLLIYPIVKANKIKEKTKDKRNSKIVENENNEDELKGQIELNLDEYKNAVDNKEKVEEQEPLFRVVKEDCSKKHKVVEKVKRANTNITAKIFVAFVIFVVSIVYTVNTTDVVKYISYQLNESTFIADEYVNPLDVNLEFPSQKRNLIYIFMESMESTYSSKDEGGAMNVNLIPEMTELANENINFSNTDKIGGATSLSGTTWTIAGMVAQTTGIPLKIGMEISNTGSMEEFLPGVCGIGEILEEEGYNNYLMIGSDSKFATRDKFFTAHGNYQIWDVNTAIEEGRMTEEEKVWWGYDDKDLYQYAKEEISKISSQDEPFNFTMLTVDTHFPDGYVCEDCENQYSEKYYNVISCASKHVYNFVKWIQEQDFYENTTIVISGDHLTMQTGYFDDLDTERTVYNVIINSAVEASNMKNRSFSTIDMFPTTLAALGVNIEGDRLGLGTNLFSDTPTLMEKYGNDYVNEEFQKSSSYYNKKFLNY